MPDPSVPDLAARLGETAERAPDHIALRWRGRSITYAQLYTRVVAGAGALQSLGLVRGDRVALMVGNTAHFVEAHFATLGCGGVVVPINTGYTATEVGHVLRDSGARFLIITAAALPVLDTIGELPDLELVIIADAEEAEEALGDGSAADALAWDTRVWDALVAEGDTFVRPVRDEDDLAALVYTSGTTGRPRGAMLTRRNLATNQDQSLAGRLQLTADDSVLLVLPLFHIYALNVGLGASVRVGATMVLEERFDAAATAAAVEQHEVTVLLGAPPMYVAWLLARDLADDAFRSVRIAVSGAAPLPEQVLTRFEERFELRIWEGYGLTEAAPSVASNAMAEHPKPGSVGLVMPGMELRLVDDLGRDVELGDPGEVWVRGSNVFIGYWNDAEGTAEALTEDGWLRTGDIGTQDADGYLYLVDRAKDLIIVSGFNVYPREVEDVLYQHPDVAEAAVVGVPDERTGEAVRAFVIPQFDQTIDLEDLAEHLSRHLARYKCPRSIEVVATLPHTATGKLRRAALREA